MANSPGDKIKYLRQLAGLSQEELGHRVGVQRAAINKYEKGTVENIPLKTIEKIAAVLDVSPTYLVGWQENRTDGLSWEAKLLHGINHFYGRGAVELLECYHHLDDNGQKRAIQYAHELIIIYGKTDGDH